VNALQCSYPGCVAIRDEAPRLEHEDAQLCALHRQADRVRRGVCLNCGHVLTSVPERNELTGRQLRRDGELVSVLVCSARCGYSKRPRPPRNRRRGGGAK